MILLLLHSRRKKIGRGKEREKALEKGGGGGKDGRPALVSFLIGVFGEERKRKKERKNGV